MRGGRYTRSLEEEIARLRAENRALVNSILGVAGIPPLKLDAEVERELRAERANARPAAAEPAAPAPARAGALMSANPLRRRSWQQIGRMLEIEEARRVANRNNSDAMRNPPPHDT